MLSFREYKHDDLDNICRENVELREYDNVSGGGAKSNLPFACASHHTYSAVTSTFRPCYCFLV